MYLILALITVFASPLVIADEKEAKPVGTLFCSNGGLPVPAESATLKLEDGTYTLTYVKDKKVVVKEEGFKCRFHSTAKTPSLFCTRPVESGNDAKTKLASFKFKYEETFSVESIKADVANTVTRKVEVTALKLNGRDPFAPFNGVVFNLADPLLKKMGKPECLFDFKE